MGLKAGKNPVNTGNLIDAMTSIAFPHYLMYTWQLPAPACMMNVYA